MPVLFGLVLNRLPKIRSRCCRAMPGPLSATLISTSSVPTRRLCTWIRRADGAWSADARALSGQCLDRVHQQVVHDLLQLDAVGLDDAFAQAQCQVDPDAVPAQRPLQQPQGVGDGLVDGDLIHRGVLTRGEALHAAHDVGSVAAGTVRENRRGERAEVAGRLRRAGRQQRRLQRQGTLMLQAALTPGQRERAFYQLQRGAFMARMRAILPERDGRQQQQRRRGRVAHAVAARAPGFGGDDHIRIRMGEGSAGGAGEHPFERVLVGMRHGRQGQPGCGREVAQADAQAQAGRPSAAGRIVCRASGRVGRAMPACRHGSEMRHVVSGQGHGLLSSTVMTRRRIRRRTLRKCGACGGMLAAAVAWAVLRSLYWRPLCNWPKDTGSRTRCPLPFSYNF